MKIIRSHITESMPEVINKCEGIVSMVLENGETCPVNDNENSMRLFRKLWDMSDKGEVELTFEKPGDIAKMYYYLIAA